MGFTPVQKLSIGTGAALALLALVGLVAYTSITQMVGGERAVAVANANISHLDRVTARTVDAENAERGYVMTGDTAYFEPLNVAQSDVENALDALRRATEDNPLQRRNLDRLDTLIGKHFREIRGTVSVRRRVGPDAASRSLRAERPIRAREGAGALAHEMREEELRVLGDRTRAMTARGHTARNFILAGSLLTLLLAFVALQPLRPSVAQRLTQRLSMAMLPSLPELQLTISESARHAGDRLVRLQQVIAAIGSKVPGSEIAQALLTRGAQPLVASLGFVVTRDGGAFTVLRALGDVVPHLAPGGVVPANLSDPLAHAVRLLEPLVVESRAERQARFPSLGRFSDSGTSDGAFIAAPLVADGEAHGVMLLAFAENRVFNDDERAYLATLGRLGGQALARMAMLARRSGARRHATT